MRTNIDIDDDLMRLALRRRGKTVRKTELLGLSVVHP